MTRKEAINILKELRVPFPDIKNINYEALDMAIQALEQQIYFFEIPLKDDYIKKQEIIKKMIEHYTEGKLISECIDECKVYRFEEEK